MTLEEIFATKPELLKEPEVQLLINYCEKVHEKNCQVFMRYIKFHEKVLETVVQNEQMIINGTSDKNTVQRILKLTNEF